MEDLMRSMELWVNYLQRKFGDQRNCLAALLPLRPLTQPDTLHMGCQRAIGAGGKRREDWGTVADGQVIEKSGHHLVALSL